MNSIGLKDSIIIMLLLEAINYLCQGRNHVIGNESNQIDRLYSSGSQPFETYGPLRRFCLGSRTTTEKFPAFDLIDSKSYYDRIYIKL